MKALLVAVERCGHLARTRGSGCPLTAHPRMLSQTMVFVWPPCPMARVHAEPCTTDPASSRAQWWD